MATPSKQMRQIEISSCSSSSSTVGMPIDHLSDKEKPEKSNDTHRQLNRHNGVEDDHRELNGSNGYRTTRDLENRVHELETKLSVLSRLLQTQQVSPALSRTPPRRRSVSPSGRRQSAFSSPSRSQLTIPPLESPGPSLSPEKDDYSVDLTDLPAPPLSSDDSKYRDAPDESASSTLKQHLTEIPENRRLGTKRNLSFRLLYENNEAEYDRRSSAPPAQHSMTAAERSWLGPMILQFQKTENDAEQAKAKAKEELFSDSNVPSASVRTKWLNYLNSFQDSTPDIDGQMEEFVKVPAQMEALMGYGFFVCMDSFLYMITILPIRFVWSCFLLLLRMFLWKKPALHLQFHRRHSYQLIQVTIVFLIYRYVLAGISIGKFYHWIRGQAMIKLYVIIAMVEVFDRLFCGLGQDCLESMYWNMVSRPKSSRMVTSIILVLGYATCHTLILFVHVETLNVAMNSADQALLTLLISGNFAEIKTTVFKKYNRPALFKIAASDICERFKLGLFLGLVLLLNICQGMEAGQLYDYARICCIVWCAELVADSIKHSFITKFNFLPAKVYREYALLLAGDVTGIGHEGVNLDHSHAVVKRIGFAQLPLVCVLSRLLREALKYGKLNGFLNNLSTSAVYGLGFGVWLSLVGVKMALGSLLQKVSLTKLRNAPEVSTAPTKGKKTKLKLK